LLVAPVLALMLGGCTDSVVGKAVPVPSNSTSTTVESAGAPRVDQPVDARKFVANPCSAVAADKWRQFHIASAGQGSTSDAVAKYAGPYCGWFTTDSPGKSLSIGFLTGPANGISGLYGGHARGGFSGYWDETSVDGYPAVFAGGSVDNRADGYCTIAVGISDRLAFQSTYQGTRGDDACGLTKRFAGAAVETMKAGG
jgi:hypothetical protein